MRNAYDIVAAFEQRVADFTGAPYAVAVESCTAALFLSLSYLDRKGEVEDYQLLVPARTYCSVPMAVINAGYEVSFVDENWIGAYRLDPMNVWDAAKRFTPAMFPPLAAHQQEERTFVCLSFHAKKRLAIGRGGMILTNDDQAVPWLRRARYDGREGKPYSEERITQLGWNMYMTPEQAARGLMLMDALPSGPLPDLEEDYPDLREQPVFHSYR